jgi:hypothetical protein
MGIARKTRDDALYISTNFFWKTQCIIKATSVDILHPKFCQSFVEIICDFVLSAPYRVFLVKGKSLLFCVPNIGNYPDKSPNLSSSMINWAQFEGSLKLYICLSSFFSPYKITSRLSQDGHCFSPFFFENKTKPTFFVRPYNRDDIFR